MRNHLNKATVLGLMFLLTGCQSLGGIFNSDPLPSQGSYYYPSTPSFSSRPTLAQAVQEGLMRSGDPLIAQVHVETNQRVVILSGYVKKIRQSDTAAQIAGQIAGPQNVQNNIIVRQ